MTGVRVTADVVIVGSGFAGALAALALRRLGRSVALVERGHHPRFAIGESSTPLANLLLEELCDRYGLTRIRPLSKWGTWQRQYPAIGCGLKRGFSFFRHDFDVPFRDDRRHQRQLLVAASPHDEIGDTHWYRPDVDHFLVLEAQDAGAEYLDGVELAAVRFEARGPVLEGTREGLPLAVEARFLIDASGTRGFLHRALGLQERPLRWMPPTQGMFTHFADVDRWEDVVDDPDLGPPVAGAESGRPFPPDAAALHHVFPGGWIWVLRFNNGITSAGAALTDALASSVGAGEDGAWYRLLRRLPSVHAQFRRARPIRPFIHSPRLPFRSAVVSGSSWALLPSAAGVIDPLLSTGFPLTLLGLVRLLDLLERSWGKREFSGGLRWYAYHTLRELDATERLVGALYAAMTDFELFKRLTLLYFAAASFSETVRRLGRPERARGFLLCDDPVFGSELNVCAEAALASPRDRERDALLARIDRAIEPFDVAGLGDRRRADWFPVRADDIVAGRSKLGATLEEVSSLLQRCGFAHPASCASLSKDGATPAGTDVAVIPGS